MTILKILTEIDDRLKYDANVKDIGAAFSNRKATWQQILTEAARNCQEFIEYPVSQISGITITSGTQFKNCDRSDRVLLIHKAWWQDGSGNKTLMEVRDTREFWNGEFETASIPTYVHRDGGRVEFRPIPSSNGTLLIRGVQGQADIIDGDDGNDLATIPLKLDYSLVDEAEAIYLTRFTEFLDKAEVCHQRAQRFWTEWNGDRNVHKYTENPINWNFADRVMPGVWRRR